MGLPKNKKLYLLILEEEKKKTIFFVCIFDISPRVFYSNFDRERSLDAELNSASNEYPLGILLTDPATQKQEIPEKT